MKKAINTTPKLLSPANDTSGSPVEKYRQPSIFRDLWVPILSVVIILLGSVVVWWTMIRIDDQPKQAKLGSLIYGWDPWPGTLPMLIASEQGYFAKYGLQVELKKEDSNSALVSDLAAGQIDFASDVVANEVVLEVNKGQSWQIVAVADASIGADGIVSRQDITSIKDLKGKRVAVEEDTFEELLLFAALEDEGLTLNDVTMVDLNAQDAAAAFVRQEVDAAVTYEPDFSQAVTAGNGRRLFTTADTPNLVIDTIVFPQSIIDSAPEKITAVLRAYFDGVTFLKDHPTEAYAIGAKHFNIPAVEVATQIQRMKIYDLPDNVQAMSYFAGQASLYSSLTVSEKYLLEDNLLTEDIYPDAVITPNFIQEMTPTSETTETVQP